MSDTPPRHAGLRHVALYVEAFEDCLAFYTGVFGMQVEWQPDADNVFLTSGNDNLALHRATSKVARPPHSAGLDHIGFIIDAIEDVDRWHDHVCRHGARITAQVKTHRDGARSFYCLDPDGNSVQMIYHPPISAGPPALGD